MYAKNKQRELKMQSISDKTVSLEHWKKRKLVQHKKESSNELKNQHSSQQTLKNIENSEDEDNSLSGLLII